MQVVQDVGVLNLKLVSHPGVQQALRQELVKQVQCLGGEQLCNLDFVEKVCCSFRKNAQIIVIGFDVLE